MNPEGPRYRAPPHEHSHEQSPLKPHFCCHSRQQHSKSGLNGSHHSKYGCSDHSQYATDLKTPIRIASISLGVILRSE